MEKHLHCRHVRHKISMNFLFVLQKQEFWKERRFADTRVYTGGNYKKGDDIIFFSNWKKKNPFLVAS